MVSRSCTTQLVYVFGRRDSTISYMGANIYPEDVETSLFSSTYASRLGAFCLELLEDERTRESRPCIHVEVMDGELTADLAQALLQSLSSKLAELNADFRQAVREDSRAGELQVVLHHASQGPFAQNLGRIKRRYILDTPYQKRSTGSLTLSPITAA